MPVSGSKKLNYLGQVNYIYRSDEWKHFSDNTPGFMGGARETASASDKGQIQLWNPAASGKTLYLLSIHAPGAPTLQRVNLLHHNVALSTAGPTGTNKLIGGSVPVGLIKSQCSGTIQGTTFASSYVGQNGLVWQADKSPFRIPEGYGICCSLWEDEVDWGCIFEWLEL